ncbi:MAG: 2-succinyl-6-hydroxy-2,4-cyclohexadiene-1-carboxylate synthase, partial [uncultured Rubrobacteraceae bacterium]
ALPARLHGGGRGLEERHVGVGRTFLLHRRRPPRTRRLAGTTPGPLHDGGRCPLRARSSGRGRGGSGDGCRVLDGRPARPVPCAALSGAVLLALSRVRLPRSERRHRESCTTARRRAAGETAGVGRLPRVPARLVPAAALRVARAKRGTLAAGYRRQAGQRSHRAREVAAGHGDRQPTIVVGGTSGPPGPGPRRRRKARREVRRDLAPHGVARSSHGADRRAGRGSQRARRGPWRVPRLAAGLPGRSL